MADKNNDFPEPVPSKKYELILTEERFDFWLQKLQAADVFAFDTETTSLNTLDAKLVGISFSVTPGEAAYVPMAHDYSGAPKQLTLEFVLSKLRPLLADPNKTIVGQNLKYDINVLANYDVVFNSEAFGYYARVLCRQ